MFDSKLAYTLQKFFKENPYKRYSPKELSKILKVKKHGYRNLLDTLNILRKDKKLVLSNKTFALAPTSSHKKTIIGKLDATSLAKNNTFAFVLTEGSQDDIFISLEDLNGAYHNDQVEVELRFRRGRRHHGTILRVVERARDKFVGTIRQYRRKFYFTADNGRIHTEFLVGERKEAIEGDKVVLEIRNWGDPTKGKVPIGDITEILGKAGDPDVEVLSVIRFYDLPLEFPEKVMEEANAINSEIIVSDNRVDLRELDTFTIDPASAKDFDDAISFIKTEHGWKLYVHIADVAHYVKKGTALFDEAAKRGNSFYFPKRVIPMLPKEISNKLCSLRPFEEKYVLTTIFEMNNKFEIIEESVCEAVIRSDLRLTYQQVDDYFDGKDVDIPEIFCKTLDELKKLSHNLTKKRIKNGYLMFSLPDKLYVFGDDGHLEKIVRDSETDSHKMIENCMLLANEYIARLLTVDAGITMYRIHDKPEIDRLLDMRKLLKYYGIEFETNDSLNHTFQNVLESIPSVALHRVFDRSILRMMKKAKYSTDRVAHFGLAIDTYTHFTSPIRRLCDLIVHHQVKRHVIRKSKKIFSFGELKQHSTNASKQELLANETEREVDKKNIHTFMQKKIGEEYKAFIVQILPSKVILELEDMPIRGVITHKDFNDGYLIFDEAYMRLVSEKSKNLYQLGTELNVVLAKVTDDIYFSKIIEK